MNKYIEKIVDYIEVAKSKYPDTPLERDGSILYCNGNDTTAFDWEVNNRLCEFGCGYKEGSVWAFKLLISKEGLATLYCYPNGEQQPVETIEKHLFTEKEMLELYDHMYYKYDCKGHWNEDITDVEEFDQ